MLGYWLFDAASPEPQGAARGGSQVAGESASAPRALAKAISVALRP
jgi:hypothetical protein